LWINRVGENNNSAASPACNPECLQTITGISVHLPRYLSWKGTTNSQGHILFHGCLLLCGR
jgi:hypothetical protein